MTTGSDERPPGPLSRRNRYCNRVALRTGTVALQVQGLRKNYGTIEAVADLSFGIKAGEVFGLLGPNGAGKTTTISVIATQLRPTAGDALVFGRSVRHDVRALRRTIRCRAA